MDGVAVNVVKYYNGVKIKNMKAIYRTYLPDEIVYNRVVYKLNRLMSTAMQNSGTHINTIRATLREEGEGRKAIVVKVLARNLRSREDAHGKPYKYTNWIFTNK